MSLWPLWVMGLPDNDATGRSAEVMPMLSDAVLAPSP